MYKYILVLIVLNSCGYAKMQQQLQLTPISKGFSGTYENYAYKYKLEKRAAEIGKDGTTLTKLLYLTKVKNGTIGFKLLTNKAIELYFQDSINTTTKTVKGKLSNRGLFITKIIHHRVQIPPIFPFLYNSTNIEKFFIESNTANDLVVTLTYVNEGNILIFGAGNSYTITYFFKKI